jgi:S-adenosylmethionine/arginine decarboxylase-like enzyme
VQRQRLKHTILVLDCQLKKALPVNSSKKDAEKFTKGLMKILDMKPLGPFSFFKAKDLSEPGWSFIQPITTSHISAHYFSRPDPLPHIHIDIYSCKDFDSKKVIKFLMKQMFIDTYIASVINREIKSKRKMTTIYNGRISR